MARLSHTTILGLAALALPCAGGDITGRIHAQMGQDAPNDAGGGKYASRRYRFLETVDYASLQDFVVHIDGVVKPADPATVRAQVAQRDGMFVPHVLPITVGTTVVWPNEDSIYHNVFSMSETTPFDLGYYKSDEDPKSVVFSKTGKVDVFCSIHAEMNCLVLVLPNPWFAKADESGRFVIRDVPAGTYQLRGWHERLPARTIEVTVPATGSVEIDLPLGLAFLPKP